MRLTGFCIMLLAFSAGCASPVVLGERANEPGALCDARVVSLNRRLCVEKRGVFTEPNAAGKPCGACAR